MLEPARFTSTASALSDENGWSPLSIGTRALVQRECSDAIGSPENSSLTTLFPVPHPLRLDPALGACASSLVHPIRSETRDDPSPCHAAQLETGRVIKHQGCLSLSQIDAVLTKSFARRTLRRTDLIYRTLMPAMCLRSPSPLPPLGLAYQNPKQ